MVPANLAVSSSTVATSMKLLPASSSEYSKDENGAHAPCIELVLNDVGLDGDRILDQHCIVVMACGASTLFSGAQDLSVVFGLACLRPRLCSTPGGNSCRRPVGRA